MMALKRLGDSLNKMIEDMLLNKGISKVFVLVRIPGYYYDSHHYQKEQ